MRDQVDRLLPASEMKGWTEWPPRCSVELPLQPRQDPTSRERVIETMKTRQIVLMATALGLAACESSTDPGDELSSTEASALAAAILDLTLDAGMAQTATAQLASGPAAAPRTFDTRTQVEGPCPLGGTMQADLHVAGAFDSATGQGQLDLDVTAQHRGCQVRAKETGQLFELDGKPSITAEFRLVSKPDQAFTLSGSYKGAVDWSSDGRSGTCSFDLTFSGNVSANTGNGTAKLEGEACGANITYDFAG
jgi:hypothetical protein